MTLDTTSELQDAVEDAAAGEITKLRAGDEVTVDGRIVGIRDRTQMRILWTFRVKGFGPLTVGIDAHGNSLYRDVQTRAQARLEELVAGL